MIPPKKLCNRSPGFGALVVQEETPYPLSDDCLTDGLPKLMRQHSVMVSSCHSLVLLLPSTGGPAFPGVPFCLGIPHQACVDTPIPEVHPHDDAGLDLIFPADAQCLSEDNVGKDERYLRVPTPVENPPPLHCQNCCEAATHCS